MCAPGMTAPADARARVPLTRRAHDRVGRVLETGGRAVDATAGNGHDTRFLARQVGPQGHIWAFDIQSAAIAACRERLREQELAQRVTLHQAGHERMAELLPDRARGRLRAVMFNLGYLPGSDKRVTTQPDTTRTALNTALEWLHPDGLISILVYRGHAGGMAEAEAVADWLAGLEASGAGYERHGGTAPGAPILYLVRRSA